MLLVHATRFALVLLVLCPPAPIRAAPLVQCDGCIGLAGTLDSDISPIGTINIAVSNDDGVCVLGESGCDEEPCRPQVTIWWTLDGTYTGSVCVNNACKPKMVSGTNLDSKTVTVGCGETDSFSFSVASMSVSTDFTCTACLAY